MPADHAHFNGSVNLSDAESVMREIAARVPSGVRRIPDGETGDRGTWILFQLQVRVVNAVTAAAGPPSGWPG
ncbi:MAG TPA: hypothetical protein VFW50_05195 [Streptosporangiaceae bacterium]|nr:hypothetical protein [Streptosporangiaceae bacterium]